MQLDIGHVFSHAYHFLFGRGGIDCFCFFDFVGGRDEKSFFSVLSTKMMFQEQWWSEIAGLLKVKKLQVS